MCKEGYVDSVYSFTDINRTLFEAHIEEKFIHKILSESFWGKRIIIRLNFGKQVSYAKNHMLYIMLYVCTLRWAARADSLQKIKYTKFQVQNKQKWT